MIWIISLSVFAGLDPVINEKVIAFTANPFSKVEGYQPIVMHHNSLPKGEQL